ncbi:MAG TPA: hypothetical protein VGO58_06585 [Chitinophagaceae bacterium]|jgi:hypothetical protein|nr:hypothetical protein [Chitinophagaceae bacterium]
MGFKKNIFLPLLFIAQLVSAQKEGSIRATVDKKKILIGEPMVLTIETELRGSSKLIKIDSIPHFELLKEPKIDSSSGNNTVKISVVMELTSFDSGHWVIPSFALTKDIRTDTIPVDVVFSDFDPTKDYNSIKDILDVNVTKKKFPWWWYAAGGVVLIAVLIWLARRKAPVVVASAPKAAISPYDDAIKELEQLERNKPAAKLYYSKLTDIFRLYIYRKKGILSLQKTTDDLVVQLKDLNLGKEQFDKLSQSLRLSDFVKFAKYVPAEEDDRTAFRDILQAIKTIEQAEIK